MLELVTRPGEVSTQWMNQALRQSGHLGVGAVSGLEYKITGTGKMGDSSREETDNGWWAGLKRWFYGWVDSLFAWLDSLQ